MNIYVASSWKNHYQPIMVDFLKANHHEVYDFRNPSPCDEGFAWKEVDENWEKWKLKDYLIGLEHPLAQSGFRKDFKAMKWADLCLLVLPCGRSAHLEAGWFLGQNKPILIYSPKPEKVIPELMYLMAGIMNITDNLNHLLTMLNSIQKDFF